MFAVFAVAAVALVVVTKLAVALDLPPRVGGWVVQGVAILLIGGACVYALRTR